MKYYIKLTQNIIFYWRNLIDLADELLKPPYKEVSMWSDEEGLLEYGPMKYMTFWYILNHEWYKMNDKKFSYTHCKEPYSQPHDDFFDED